MRFETNEIEWISQYILNNLVFCKSELQLKDDRVIASLMEILWQILDLFGEQKNLSIADEMSNRYNLLQSSLKKLLRENLITVK